MPPRWLAAAKMMCLFFGLQMLSKSKWLIFNDMQTFNCTARPFCWGTVSGCFATWNPRFQIHKPLSRMLNLEPLPLIKRVDQSKKNIKWDRSHLYLFGEVQAIKGDPMDALQNLYTTARHLTHRLKVHPFKVWSSSESLIMRWTKDRIKKTRSGVKKGRIQHLQ